MKPMANNTTHSIPCFEFTTSDNNAMQPKPDLRVFLKWMIAGSGSRCYTQVLAPGPNVSQQVAISCILCRPIHIVCGPGGPALLRFT